MTKSELTAILGSRMIRQTEHAAVVELRPSLFGRGYDRLTQLINVIIKAHPNLFFCPHEFYEGDEPRYQMWVRVEAGTWAVPSTATADDLMNDPENPYGWTLYAATEPLSETESTSADFGSLVASGRVTTFVFSDPDGSPLLVGVTPDENCEAV